MLGGFAAAIVFICLLVLTGIVGSLFAAYAAYCLLAVVRATAAGSDAVGWRDDSLFEKLIGGSGVLAVAALSLAPAGLLGAEHAGLRFALLAPGALLLLFPP